MQELFKNAAHISPIKKAARAVKFGKLTWQEQLAFIRDQAKEINHGSPETRAEDLLALLERVDNPVDATSKALGAEIIDAIKNEPSAFNRIYSTIAANLFNQKTTAADIFSKKKSAPLPPLDALAPLMQAAANARTASTFEQAGNAMLEMIRAAPQCPWERFTWPASFAIPYVNNTEGITPPWDTQVKWAISALKEGRTEPAQVLVILGVEDPRLYEAMPDTLIKRVLLGQASLANFRRLEADPSGSFILDSLKGTKDPIPALSQPMPLPKDFRLHVRGKELIMTAPSRDPWDGLFALVNVLEKREAALLKMQAGKESEPKFKHTQALPFHNEAEFEHWFADYREALMPPAIMMTPNHAMERFQGRLMAWYDEHEEARRTMISGYKASIDQGRLGGSARYDAQFMHVLTQQIMPFEAQALQVTQMFEDQLTQGGETGKKFVRDFFLNSIEKPGLRQLLESGPKGALLVPSNAYVEFLRQHPGIFSIEEKASILSQHVTFSQKPLWWEEMFETHPIADVKSLFEFIAATQNFSDHLRPLEKSKVPELTRKFDDSQTRLPFFADVAKPYFLTILGYNDPGQFDVSALLEQPAALIENLCATPIEEGEMEYRYDLEHFIPRLLTEQTKDNFAEWCAAHVTKQQLKESFELADIKAPTRKAYLEYMKTSYGFKAEYMRCYMNQGEELLLSAKLPVFPFQNADSLRNILRDHVTAQTQWPQEYARRAAIYKNLDKLDLFPNSSMQEKFRDELLADIKQEPDKTKRLNSLQLILAGEPVKDPAMRKTVSELWVSTLAEEMAERQLGAAGKDDGQAAYLEALMPSIQWAEKNVSDAERYHLFIQLADALESQKALSYRLRDSFTLNREDIERTDKYFRGGEAVLIYAVRQSKRQGLLDYLMRENTPESKKEFGEWLAAERRDVQAIVTNDVDPKNYHYAFLDAIQAPSNNPDYYPMQAQNLYNNFWQAPLPARIAIMDQLLMAPEEKEYQTDGEQADETKHAESGAAYDRAFAYVADHLLPPGLAYVDESRAALETYKDILPPNERALFLSALLGANEAVKQASGVLPVGERLAIVLEMMGPATVKFGQALSNYPDAPTDLRKPMVRLTKHASPSVRWDLWSRYEDVVPEAYRQNVTRMGKVLGTGSYQEGVRLEKADGTHSVMKLQRPHVERRAEAGFQQLRDFVQSLKHRESSINENIAEAADNCVQQAQKMAAKETDANYRLAQIKQAQGYYNPLTIKVDEHTFHFQTARWLAYGVDREEIPNRTDRKEWCDEEEMPGIHFDELPANTLKEKSYKKALAKAVVTSELSILLSGRPIDNDRHPAQLRVDAQTDDVGLFDHGALDLDPPSLAEKQELAKILVNITQAYKQGASLPELFYNQLQEIKAKQGRIPDYLVKVERGVLAMTPFFEQMSSDDLEEALAAVHQAGFIDKEILNTTIRVKLPVIGEQDIKLSTALKRVLPGKPKITLSTHAIAGIAEPVRFDYQHQMQKPHPQFPGVRTVDKEHLTPTPGDSAKEKEDAPLKFTQRTGKTDSQPTQWDR